MWAGLVPSEGHKAQSAPGLSLASDGLLPVFGVAWLVVDELYRSLSSSSHDTLCVCVCVRPQISPFFKGHPPVILGRGPH